jgi:NitT/TauT family transport system ATP-binding protein
MVREHMLGGNRGRSVNRSDLGRAYRVTIDVPRTPDGAASSVTARPMIEISNVDKIFKTVRNERIHALSDINLKVADREFVTIVGPSGCGKSTLLKILAGLLDLTKGNVLLDGSPVKSPRRDIGIMFQSPVLLPWRTVEENIMLPVEVQGLPKVQARGRVDQLLSMVGLEGFGNKYPMELSGGMQQRAAICRALINDPRILLMDEPFGALDAMTREQMNLDLQRIWAESGKTVVLITHSIPEAVFLGDRVIVMSPRPGRITEIVDVPIPRPRPIEAMGDPLFGRLTSQIRKLLYGMDSGRAAVSVSGGGLG